MITPLPALICQHCGSDKNVIKSIIQKGEDDIEIIECWDRVACWKRIKNKEVK